MTKNNLLVVALAAVLASCGGQSNNETAEPVAQENAFYDPASIYTTFKLTTDLSKVSEAEKKMIPILIEAAKIMDDLFWIESYGDRNELLTNLPDDRLVDAVNINYGPWDRLNGNASFVDGIGEKPLGANFYPVDMTMDEFDEFSDANKMSLYTMVRRDDEGNLKTIWYNEFFSE